MEPLDSSAAGFMDDLLDFTSDIEEADEESPSGAILPFNVPKESVDEELEWLSNKDAFPTVETFLDDFADRPDAIFKHESPVSVLESNSTNSGGSIRSCCGSLRVPVRARSKRVRRRRQVGGSVDILMQQLCWINNDTNSVSNPNTGPKPAAIKMGRKCLHCEAEKTPQWRAGPLGPKTLCNACGVRYKSGRLVPEYRPASSPTFLSSKHSNSHRRIMEMRKLKQTGVRVKGWIKVE